ncbi:MAG: hypothetical protein BGO43_06320 [Gammaproteobacteria bacterium 39-13]|nr:hypothetical protein [Gammaproteobacteria bacterium]OJV90461.1 MAG: hypothetical protein BGO43_06320 [Gammaproteobacteria bacterium 39-13]
MLKGANGSESNSENESEYDKGSLRNSDVYEYEEGEYPLQHEVSIAASNQMKELPPQQTYEQDSESELVLAIEHELQTVPVTHTLTNVAQVETPSPEPQTHPSQQAVSKIEQSEKDAIQPKMEATILDTSPEVSSLVPTLTEQTREQEKKQASANEQLEAKELETKQVTQEHDKVKKPSERIKDLKKVREEKKKQEAKTDAKHKSPVKSDKKGIGEKPLDVKTTSRIASPKPPSKGGVLKHTEDKSADGHLSRLASLQQSAQTAFSQVTDSLSHSRPVTWLLNLVGKNSANNIAHSQASVSEEKKKKEGKAYRR